ncbi:exonuclease subunit SbcD [Biostraticola tofi]|uniref:Nuclease SbcCD subunit D n=1 Tax=Biostraticola tofi TaxID=466109 RepID=A0A4R3YPQ3_9GAMM|nr:exonuclease subunit SbcD [Biostraticola tofi]TCV94351.1 exodeoxyribonuclease I subunit D [Biostraticola tofi]
MRIIHTSDWHLGQSFFTKSRAREHRAFLQWLVTQVSEHQVDAIIVAGDIFDTGTPPSYARELFNRFVVDLQPSGCQLIVLSGNHDAVATLNESRDVFGCLNTRVVAGVGNQPQALVLNEKDGRPGAILCAIPFLRARDLLVSRAGDSGGDKQHALLEAIASHYQLCYQQALALRETSGAALPVIATGHLTTVGASSSDSVREIYIGSLDAFPAQRFPPADYIALGHIHRAQRIGGSEFIRYCGSPIPLSFDEAGKPKQVNLVDFIPGNPPRVTPIFIPQVQELKVLKGTPEQVEAQLAQFSPQDYSTAVWLDIEVVTEGYLNDIQQRIQAIAEQLPVEIVLLRRSRSPQSQSLTRQSHETLTELSVSEVFERRLAVANLEDHQRVLRIKQLFAEVAGDLQPADAQQQEPS